MNKKSTFQLIRVTSLFSVISLISEFVMIFSKSYQLHNRNNCLTTIKHNFNWHGDAIITQQKMSFEMEQPVFSFLVLQVESRKPAYKLSQRIRKKWAEILISKTNKSTAKQNDFKSNYLLVYRFLLVFVDVLFYTDILDLSFRLLLL